MSAGTGADFKIYDDQYYGGQWEVIAQMLNAFNAASGGALQLTAQGIVGSYQKESFIQQISGLISRRDLTSIATAADLKMAMDEFINVKINRKIGPIAQTLDAWKKIGKTPEEFSFVLGQMIAQSKLQDQVNTTIMALAAALANQSNNLYDATGDTTKTMNHLALTKAMAKFGDASASIICWVMHSKPYFDLVGQAITDKIFGVANATIYNGNVATLGRPTIVIDAPGLFTENNSHADTYLTLGLTAGAAGTKESEPDSIVMQTITGNEQLFQRLQGEYSYNVGLKGFQWDTTHGGANPTDAALATGTNWDKVVTSHKHLGGVALKTQ